MMVFLGRGAGEGRGLLATSSLPPSISSICLCESEQHHPFQCLARCEQLWGVLRELNIGGRHWIAPTSRAAVNPRISIFYLFTPCIAWMTPTLPDILTVNTNTGTGDFSSCCRSVCMLGKAPQCRPGKAVWEGKTAEPEVHVREKMVHSAGDPHAAEKMHLPAAPWATVIQNGSEEL